MTIPTCHGRASTIDGAGQTRDLAALRSESPRVWSCAVESRASLPIVSWGGAVREASLVARCLFGSGGASHQLVEWDATCGAQIAIPAASVQLGIRSREQFAWPAGLVVAVVGTVAEGTSARTIRPTLTSDQIGLTVAGGVAALPIPAYARAALVREELGDYTAGQWFGAYSRDGQVGAGSSIDTASSADWQAARNAGMGIPVPGQARFLVLDVTAGNARVFCVQWELDL